MARRRSRSSRRRRRGRFSGLYRFLAVLAVLAAVAVACVVFFRINEVTVTGHVRYTEEEVVAATGIKTGDNLMALSKGQVASAVRAKLPYVESVSIRRRLPDGVEITVRERVAAASIDSDSGRWLISSQGKLLEQAGDQTVLQIQGLKTLSPYAGGSVQVAEEDANTLSHLVALLTALEEKEMIGGCRELDCSPKTYLELTWDIYTIKFPRGGDYPYMLRMLEHALASEEMPQGEAGTFDFTVKDGELYFKRTH